MWFLLSTYGLLHSKTLSHSGGPPMLFGPIASNPHDDGL